MTLAAPVLLKLTSATFKGKSIASAQSAQVGFQGSSQQARGDGAVAMQIAWVEGIHGKVQVTAHQAHLSDKDLINPGAGALVLVGFEQDQGAAKTVTAHTWTFANATLDDTSRGIPLDGVPTINLNFTIVAPTGDIADLVTIT